MYRRLEDEDNFMFVVDTDPEEPADFGELYIRYKQSYRKE